MLHEIKIGAELGGDAPSVEANSKIAATAFSGAIPASTKAEYDTAPNATMVALAFIGPAARVMIPPTSKTMTGAGRLKLPNSSLVSAPNPATLSA